MGCAVPIRRDCRESEGFPSDMISPPFLAGVVSEIRNRGSPEGDYPLSWARKGDRSDDASLIETLDSPDESGRLGGDGREGHFDTQPGDKGRQDHVGSLYSNC